LLALFLLAPFAGWWPLLPAAGILAADAALVWMRLKRRGLPISLPALVAGRMRALGSLVYYLSYHLVRYYSAALLALAALVPFFWVVPVVALGCAAGVDYAVRRPRLSFIRFAGIYFLEQLAYGTGVFWGCLRMKCFSSYRVAIFRHVELTT
ncbi:MAG TPA: mycofactocin system glycosyltransferase, partial [Geobacteraceae bacterium]|nr:mycofactocin system glycosyltransferase [Geobacteraceae bacterium]